MSETPSVMMIVARGDKSLYQYVQRRFHRESEFEVFLDRRQGPRRRTAEAPAVERRKVERRRPDRDDLLKAQGWLVVRSRDVGYAGFR